MTGLGGCESIAWFDLLLLQVKPGFRSAEES